MNLLTSKHKNKFISIDPGVNQLGLATFEDNKLLDATVKIIPKEILVRQRLLNLDSILQKYIIEKRKRFLFWTWWSQDYLFDAVFCCHESYDKNDMLNMLSILRGEKNWTDTKVIS